MFLNKSLEFIQRRLDSIYSSSLILQSLDKIIFITILLTFMLSTFMSSDVTGYFCFTVFLLTILRASVTPNDRFKCEKFEIFLLLYFLICIISVAGSTLFTLSLKGFFKTFIYLSFYLSIVHHLKYNRKNIIPILLSLAACVTFESLIGLSQNFVKVAEISGWQDTSRLNPEEVMTRVYGTLQPLNPNLLGGYLVASITSVFGMCAYYFLEKKYKRGIAFLLLSGLSSLVIFLTGCRGAYIALGLIYLLIFLLSLKFFWAEYKKYYFYLLSVLVSFCTFILLTISSIRARIFSIFAMRADSSNSFRFNVYQAGLEMFKDNWLLGIGVGNQNFREIYGLYMKTGFDALSTYNIYLEIAVESGIFALITFIIFISTLLIHGVNLIKKSTNYQDIIFASVAMVSICGVLIHGVVDTVFFRPQIQVVFWTMVAILSNCIYGFVEKVKK